METESNSINDLDILKTFFHEAAVHAGLEAQGVPSEHSPGPPNYTIEARAIGSVGTPADDLSYQIELAIHS